MTASNFATEEWPLRASSLPGFMLCPFSVVLSATMEREDTKYAQTGTLIHAGIQAYHETGSSDIGLLAMASKRKELPLAEEAKAVGHFQRYVEKEKEYGQVILCEKKISIRLEPTESDPTQKAIVINGKLDQVRRIGGKAYLADLKTGSKLARDMLNAHAPQLAAYQLGAADLLGEPVDALLIRTADFFQGGPVFHFVEWTPAQARIILEPIREMVAQVRRAARVQVPGQHCRYCPALTVANCTSEAPRRAEAPRVELTTVAELFQ